MQNKGCIKFISDIKEDIIKSRYQAARLVNKELILLYFQVGEKLSVKIKSEKWGAKVIQSISEDLQNQLQGLRGFSKRNLFNMIQFHEAYGFLQIVQSATAQLKSTSKSIMPSSTAQLKSIRR